MSTKELVRMRAQRHKMRAAAIIEEGLSQARIAEQEILEPRTDPLRCLTKAARNIGTLCYRMSVGTVVDALGVDGDLREFTFTVDWRPIKILSASQDTATLLLHSNRDGTPREVTLSKEDAWLDLPCPTVLDEVSSKNGWRYMLQPERLIFYKGDRAIVVQYNRVVFETSLGRL